MSTLFNSKVRKNRMSRKYQRGTALDVVGTREAPGIGRAAG
jgi:hypothetical protein